MSLTTNIETLPAAGVTAAANAVFTAPAGVTPQGVQANTLQSGDVLNGSGQQNVLNATFVNAAAIAPTINNIPTVNITSLVAGANLNLGASTGINTIGDVNSVADVSITGAKTALTTLNKSAGISRSTEVIFQNNVLNGPANAVAINLDGVDGGNIRLEAATPSSTNGYETFNVNAVSASSIGRLISGGSLDNIIVSGANLSIRGSAGFDALEPSLLRFNAAAQTGSITVGRIDNGVGLTQGASVVNAAAEDLNFVGSNNGTTLFVQGTSLGNNDNLAGGTGSNDILVLTGASTAAGTVSALGPNTATFTASGFETLALTDTDGRGVSGLSNYDLVNVTGVNTIALGTKSNRVVALGNYNYTGPLSINVIGNGTTETTNAFANGIVLSTPQGAGGDNTTVNYTLGNRGRTFGNNTINNGGINLPFVENVSLTYNDFSSNTDLDNAVFQGSLLTPLNTNSLEVLSVNAATGSSARGGITLAADGGNPIAIGRDFGSIEQVTINSAVGVTGIFNNVVGATVTTSGSGDHELSAAAAFDGGAIPNVNAININGSAGTGDQRFDGARGADALTGGSGDDRLRGLEGNDALSGNSGDDEILGADGSDIINGGDGNDVIDAGADADVANGGTGNDTIDGGLANDTIDGASGNDVITGGAFADSLTGGVGTDTFNQAIDASRASTASSIAGATVAVGDSLTFGNGLDIITDFSAGAAGDIANVLVAGLPTSLIGETAANLTNNQEVFFASGLFNAQTNTFTIAPNGAGPDTVIVQADNAVGASDVLTTNASIFLLRGVNSNTLAAGNFI